MLNWPKKTNYSIFNGNFISVGGLSVGRLSCRRIVRRRIVGIRSKKGPLEVIKKTELKGFVSSKIILDGSMI